MSQSLQKKLIIKEIINQNFTFSDLSPRFINVDSSTGNIFCPFHDNHDTPAAKMYWDESQDIWILHCFGECHRNFTAYDYVDLILCEKYGKYKSPVDFLENNLQNKYLKDQLKLYEGRYIASTQEYYKKKINYINEVFENSDSIEDFIEELYTS